MLQVDDRDIACDVYPSSTIVYNQETLSLTLCSFSFLITTTFNLPGLTDEYIYVCCSLWCHYVNDIIC